MAENFQSLKTTPAIFSNLWKFIAIASLLSIRAVAMTDDPRGPIVARGIESRIVVGGVEAKDFQYEPEKAPASWSAPWIWLSTNSKKTAVACFRKQVELKSVPAKCGAWVSGDWHYRLFVNGHLASRGPADPGADYPGGCRESRKSRPYPGSDQ